MKATPGAIEGQVPEGEKSQTQADYAGDAGADGTGRQHLEYQTKTS
jgi:hypothetical protein